MAYPTAQQYGAVHTLVSPSGYRAVFNNSADADYIGDLVGEEAVTGLDSPEVRTSMVDRVQADGSVAGPFFSGSRPVTLKPTILAASVAARNLRESKLRKCVNDCLLYDGTLTWTPDGSVSQYVKVRASQPTRITGGWAKQAMVGLLAPNPLILSTDEQTMTSAPNVIGFATNEGEVYSPPTRIRIHGPGTGPAVANYDTLKTLGFFAPNLVLTSSEYVDIDVLNGTAVKGSLPLLNPGAEIDTANWNTSGSFWLNAGATLTRTTVSGERNGGVAGFKVVTPASPAQTGMQQQVSLVAGRTYTVSAWVKGATAGQSLGIGIGDSTVGNAATYFTTTGSWQRVSVTLTAAAAGTTNVALLNAPASAVTFYTDDWLLTSSSYATTNVFDNISFPAYADWLTLKPGSNALVVTWISGSSALSHLRVDYRYAWK